MKHTIIFPFIILALNTSLWAQSNNLYASMDEALDHHRNGEAMDDSFKAITSFEEIVKEHPERWEPHFWASYVYTQISRSISNRELSERNLKRTDLLNSSQKHLDIAKRDMFSSEVLKSDYHVLQALIYSFRSSSSSSDFESAQYQAKYNEELNNALLANIENPVALVSAGIILFLDGREENDFGKVIAGKVMLEKAGTLFDEHKKEYYTQNNYWNASWYKYWLGRVNKFFETE